jgi:hypothetical protein
MHISSVPLHARKVLESCPTRAGWSTRRRQIGQRCDFANPPGENRAVQLDTLTSKDLRLAMERGMVAIFCYDHMGK